MMVVSALSWGILRDKELLLSSSCKSSESLDAGYDIRVTGQFSDFTPLCKPAPKTHSTSDSFKRRRRGKAIFTRRGLDYL
jgi:hypothetical protein